MVEDHPDPEKEEIQGVESTYTIRSEQMTIARTSYHLATRAIVTRIGEIRTQARGVRPGLSDAQKAGALVMKYKRLHTDLRRRVEICT